MRIVELVGGHERSYLVSPLVLIVLLAAVDFHITDIASTDLRITHPRCVVVNRRSLYTGEPYGGGRIVTLPAIELRLLLLCSFTAIVLTSKRTDDEWGVATNQFRGWVHC